MGPLRGLVWDNLPPQGLLDTTDPPRAGHHTRCTTLHPLPRTRSHHNLPGEAVLETLPLPEKKIFFSTSSWYQTSKRKCMTGSL